MDLYSVIRSDMTNVFANTSDAGTSVTRTPVTKTVSNTYGTETLTDGTPETIFVFIQKKITKWDFDKEGEVQGGDAILYCKYEQTLNRNDKITYGTEVYRIKEVKDAKQAGNLVFKKANLFLIQ